MQRRTELWLLAIFGAVILVGVIAAGFISGTISPNGNFRATTVPALDATDWARSNNNRASVTLIEYGDFECPACGQYESVVEGLMQAYGDRVIFSFRNFPLTQVHQDAMIAAQAAEAAGLQGKYWEMHDLLYEKQSEWTSSAPIEVVDKYFNGYAQSLGMDVARFNRDINADAVKAKIQRDIDSGNAAEVNHTPTFFVNLTQIPNPGSYAAFAEVLETAIASSTAGSPQAAH